MGRKPTKDSVTEAKMIAVRLTGDEHKALRVKAATSGLSIQKIVRKLVKDFLKKV